jgi:hypothetical protein
VRTQEFSEEKIMNLKKLNMVAMIMLIGLGVMLISTFTWIGAQASEGALDDLVTLKAGSATPAVMLTAPMATFTVTNTNDSGAGSLRQAIIDANNNPGADMIAFNIPSPGPHTISPTSALPIITDPVTIDGTSEPDFTGSPIIELDGTNALAANGLEISAGSSTVRGLVINRFGGLGIFITTNGGNIVEGNFIGTDVTGSVDLGNSLGGVRIFNASNNTIGGTVASARNIISGNSFDGVTIVGSLATMNQVQGNLIGTDVTGTADLGNSSEGVSISTNAANNTIGGMMAGARNVISGNDANGVGLSGGATGNIVQGNFLGTDMTGAVALGNGGAGVIINGGSDNTIGGTAASAGNTIAFNSGRGVLVLSGTGMPSGPISSSPTLALGLILTRMGFLSPRTV